MMHTHRQTIELANRTSTFKYRRVQVLKNSDKIALTFKLLLFARILSKFKKI